MGKLFLDKNINSYNVITISMAEVFEAKLRKIGNSLGVIIPSNLIEELGVHRGDMIHVAIPVISNEKRNELLRRIAGTYQKTKAFKRDKEDRY